VIPLLARELRNARGTALALAGFLLLGDLMMLANHRVRGGDLSAFDPLALVAVPGLWILAVALARKLVGHEHQAGTRAFLEAIPVPREAVIAAKLAVGFALVALVASLQVGLFAALGAPAPDAALGARVLARVLLAGAFATGVGFAVASLGRYLTVAITSLVLAQTSIASADFDGARLAPWSLVARTFTVDRGPLPAGPAAMALVGALAGAALAAALWCARSGSVSVSLFQRMSHREGMRWAAGITLAMVLIHTDRDRARAFALPGDARRGDGAVVHGVSVDARTLDAAHAALRVLGRWAGEPPPAVALVARADVPAGMARFEDASASAALVSYHHLAGEALVAATVEAAALHRTRTHLRRESTAWALDGLGLLAARWGRAARPLDDDLDLVLPMLASLPSDLTADDLVAWRSFRERVGEDAARAVAYTLLRAVAVARGPDAVAAMLRALLARPWGPGSAAAWTLPSMSAAWRRAGLTPVEAVAAWRANALRLRDLHRASLARVPRVVAAARVEAPSARSRSLRLALTGDARLAPDAPVTVTVWRLCAESAHGEKGLAPGDIDGRCLAWHAVVPAASLAGEGALVPAGFVRGEELVWRMRAPGAAGTPHRREVLR
jgi:hypothetical protein